MAAQENWKADLLALLPGDVYDRHGMLLNLWGWSHNRLDDALFQAIIDPLDIENFRGFRGHVSRFGICLNFVNDLIAGGIPLAVEMPDAIPPQPTSSLTTSPGERQRRRVPVSDATTETSGNDDVGEDADTNAPATLV